LLKNSPEKERGYQIDNLDRSILSALLTDSRQVYSELAKKLCVSNGTIHFRIKRLKQAGILKGSKAVIDPEQLGYGVCTFIGINLEKAGESRAVAAKLRELSEVTEIYFTTGRFSLFAKVFTHSNRELHRFLSYKLHTIPGVQSTQTILILEAPLIRDVPL